MPAYVMCAHLTCLQCVHYRYPWDLQPIRMLVQVVPGAIEELKDAVAVRRVALLGVGISKGADGEEVQIQGAIGLSRLVCCNPCGEKERRVAFFGAVTSAALLAPTLSGIAMTQLANEKAWTPGVVTLSTNKQRIILVMRRVAVTGIADHSQALADATASDTSNATASAPDSSDGGGGPTPPMSTPSVPPRLAAARVDDDRLHLKYSPSAAKADAEPYFLKIKDTCIIGTGPVGSCQRLVGVRRMFRHDYAKTQAWFSTAISLRSYDPIADTAAAAANAPPASSSPKKSKSASKKADPGAETDDSASPSSAAPSNVAPQITTQQLATAMSQLRQYHKGAWTAFVVNALVGLQKVVRGWMVRRKPKQYWADRAAELRSIKPAAPTTAAASASPSTPVVPAAEGRAAAVAKMLVVAAASTSSGQATSSDASEPEAQAVASTSASAEAAVHQATDAAATSGATSLEAAATEEATVPAGAAAPETAPGADAAVHDTEQPASEAVIAHATSDDGSSKAESAGAEGSHGGQQGSTVTSSSSPDHDPSSPSPGHAGDILQSQEATPADTPAKSRGHSQHSGDGQHWP